MGILRCRLSGTMTVEASFVVSVIVLILIYQVGFVLGMYSKVDSFGKECIEALNDTEKNIASMRLTRLGFRVVGKD